MDRTWRRAVRVAACAAMWAWGGAAVAQEGAEASLAAELAGMARALAGNAKMLAAGAEGEAGYGEAERGLAEGEEAFGNGDYMGALAAWRRAAEQFAGAKMASEQEAHPPTEAEADAGLALSAATVARTAAENAKLRAAGAEGQEAYGEAERAAAEGEAAFGKGEYKGAMETWSRAADKYAEAKKNAETALRAAAEAAKERTEAAKGRAAEEPGAAGMPSYGAAERESAAGEAAFASGDYEKARAAWEKAEGKYGEARAAAAAARTKAEKLEEALSAARAAAEDEWWEEVVRQTTVALRLQPGHAEAQRLAKKAMAGLNEVPEQKTGAGERKPGTTDCAWLPEGAQLELVWCPPGAVGPGGQALPGFWIGQTEVTQEQWASVMGSASLLDSSRGVEFGRDGDWPMRAVSWTECVNFCEELGAKTGKGGRWHLPTETEWKWACEAGGGGMGSAWLKGTSGGRLHPVGEGMPNAWGVYDMRGNVAEWCANRWGEEGDDREFRVIRGGAYDSGDASRRRGREGTPEATVGFRVCLEE